MTSKTSPPITGRFMASFGQGLTPAAVVVFLLVILSDFGSASDQDLRTGGCDLSASQIAGLTRDASKDVRAMDEYQGAIRAMLEIKQFEKLDCIANHVRSSKERFPGGAWKIHVFYLGLSSPVQYPLHATSQDWETLMDQLREWATARPQSVTAHVALGSAYLQYAWQARGTGYSNTVTDNGWKLFNERTAEGKRSLKEASTLPTKDPEWYFAMQTVAQNESCDASNARALFEQAYKFEPGYYYYSQILANYLLPKWGGEKGDTEQFTDEITARVGGDEGNALYFLIARSMLCGCGDENEPKLSWERISKGYDALEKVHGVSLEALNRIAELATQNMDAVVANKAMARIGDQWSERLWKNKEEFDGWKKWAAGYAAVLAKRRENEASAEANSQTPEGARYKAAFENTYRAMIRECAKTEASNVEKFETLTCIGEHGTVEDIKIYWNAPAGMCLYQKLRGLQQSKATGFAPPPNAPYWIRLDFDGSEFSSGGPGK